MQRGRPAVQGGGGVPEVGAGRAPLGPAARGRSSVPAGAAFGETVHHRRRCRSRFRNRGASVAYVICEPCIGVKDSACVDVCPVECIYEAEDQFYIQPEECIDCDACVPACPVDAIFPEEDVPEEWTSFIQKNAELSGL
ncbi:MAG: ferredoxin family protein [Trueperaceae bacterium]|nr:ferredoxin family protein [Trueperaceae bacterium]